MILDIVIAIFLALAFGYGWGKGLIRSLLSAVSVLIAFVAAVKLSTVASFWIRDFLHVESTWLPLISLVVVFGGVLTLFALAARLLEGLLKAVDLGLVNRIAGGLVYVALAALLISALLWYSNQMGLISEQHQADSRLSGPLVAAAPGVMESVGQLVPLVRDSYDHLELFFEQMAEELPLPEPSTSLFLKNNPNVQLSKICRL